MRPQKRSRGRNGGGSPFHNNPNRGGGPRPQHRSQTFDSNGPNVKIRGNAYQVYERYLGLAREAQSAGDRIAAENFFQHAEHYFRVMNAQGEGFQQRQQHQQMSPDGEVMANGEGEQPDEQRYGYDRQQGYDRQPQGHQSHQPRHDAQGHNDHQGDDGHQGQQAQVQIQQAPPPPPEPIEDDDQLPSFITGRPE